MIGQLKNIQYIDTVIQNNALPHFIIIEGDEGSGKRTLLSYISKKLNCEIIFFDTKVDSVRELIETCYSQVKPLIYSIVDCQELSLNAQNSLLKIVEEPPKNAYIILCCNTHTLLPTIYSRAQLIRMQEYSISELIQYINKCHANDKVLEYATTPGDINKLDSIDLNEVVSLCENIIKNSDKANITSILKISQKIKLKEDKPGIDLLVFLKIFEKCVYKEMLNPNILVDTYCKLYKWHTNICLCMSQIELGYNKQYIIDNLLLTIKV